MPNPINSFETEHFKNLVTSLSDSFKSYQLTRSEHLKQFSQSIFAQKYKDCFEIIGKNISSHFLEMAQILDQNASPELLGFICDISMHSKAGIDRDSSEKTESFLQKSLTHSKLVLSADFFNFSAKYFERFFGLSDFTESLPDLIGFYLENNNEAMLQHLIRYIKTNSHEINLSQLFASTDFRNALENTNRETFLSFIQLIKPGQVFEFENFSNFTLLKYLAHKPRFQLLDNEILERLKHEFSSQESKSSNPFHVAARSQNSAFIESSIRLFQETNSISELKELLRQKNSSGKTALHIAIEKGNSAVVDSLLSYSSLEQNLKLSGGFEAGILDLLAQNKNLSQLVPKFLDRFEAENLTFTTSKENFLYKASFSENFDFLKNFLSYYSQRIIQDPESYSARKLSINKLLNQNTNFNNSIFEFFVLHNKFDLINLALSFGNKLQDFPEILFTINSEEMVEFLVSHGLDLNYQNPDFFLLLPMLSFLGLEKAAATMLNHGALPQLIDSENFSSIDYIAAFNKIDLLKKSLEAIQDRDNPEIYHYRGWVGNISEKDVEDLCHTSLARIIASLACSTKDFGLPQKILEIIISNSLPKLNLDTKERELISFLWKKLHSAETLILSDNSKINFFKVPIKDHTAYFLIHSDKNDYPLKISFCDGNSMITEAKNFGEVVYEFDPEKLKSLNCQNSERLIRLLYEVSNNLSEAYVNKDFEATFNKTLGKFVKCQNSLTESLGSSSKEIPEPIIIEQNIPTKPQNRGNCSFKSSNIVIRALMTKVNPNLTFARDENNQSFGEGYDLYKRYKNALINYALDTLLESGSEQNRDKIYYKPALETLVDCVYPWAVKKNRADLTEKITTISDREFSSNDLPTAIIKATNSSNMRENFHSRKL